MILRRLIALALLCPMVAMADGHWTARYTEHNAAQHGEFIAESPLGYNPMVLELFADGSPVVTVLLKQGFTLPDGLDASAIPFEQFGRIAELEGVVSGVERSLAKGEDTPRWMRCAVSPDQETYCRLAYSSVEWVFRCPRSENEECLFQELKLPEVSKSG